MKRVLALVAVIGLVAPPYAITRDEAPSILFDASYGERLPGSTSSWSPHSRPAPA